MTAVRRREILSLLLAGGVAGCGFRPVYGPGGVNTGSAAAELSAIDIENIPERIGQLLREDLQVRFERGGTGTPRRYDLQVILGMSGEAVAIRQDSTSSRIRLVGTASWTLFTQGLPRKQLASGRAREVDGYDVIDQQYFTADLQSEAVQRRMMDALADQVTLQLASWFRNRQAG